MTWYRSAAVTAALVISLLPSVAVADDVEPTPTAPETVETTAPETIEPSTPEETAEPVEPTAPAETTAPARRTAPAAATAPVDDPAPDLMVVGDSISATSRYARTGSEPGKIKAWWARLGFKTVKVDAVAGSGMLSTGTVADKTGASCRAGKTFLERIDEIDLRAKILIIEGGRNDFKRCVNGKITRATTHQATKEIKSYLKAVSDKIAASDSGPKVYVMSPWGRTFTSQRSKIAPIVEEHAKAYGFQWIMLPALSRTYTIADGTHPNNRGAKRLADLVIANSDIRGGKARPGVGVVCKGVSGCRKKSSSYAKSSHRAATNHRYWSQPYGPRNYVAYRLTHGGRVTERPNARVPATWKDAAVKGGQIASSKPTVGSIAWWPAGVIGKQGHIAYVEQVSKDESKVWVSEIVGRKTYRRTSYSASSFPRAFLNFRKSKGSPFGKVTGAVSTKHHRLTVTGYASDPDAYSKGVKVTIKVTQNGKVRTYTVSGRTRFDFTKTVTSGLRSGRVTVRAWAHNAKGSKGRSKVYLGSQRVTIT